MGKKQARIFYDLPQIISVLNLISDVFVTRICEECGWTPKDLEFYTSHSQRIPLSDRQMINHILKDQLSYLLENCPQMNRHGYLKAALANSFLHNRGK